MSPRIWWAFGSLVVTLVGLSLIVHRTRHHLPLEWWETTVRALLGTALVGLAVTLGVLFGGG